MRLKLCEEFKVLLCLLCFCVLVLFVLWTRCVKCVCVCYCVCFWFLFSDLEVKVGEYIELEGQGAMLETDEGQAAYYAPGCDIDSGEEGLAVLPRHTKVLVTGNNRTKSVLVGLHGVVKKAVGLGGWHWLVTLLNAKAFVYCRRKTNGDCRARLAVFFGNNLSHVAILRKKKRLEV